MAWTNPDHQTPGTKITDDIYNAIMDDLLMLATHTHTLGIAGDGAQKVTDRWFPVTVAADTATMTRLGDYPAAVMSSNIMDAHVSFNCPSNFLSLVSLLAIFIANTTNTITYGHSGSRAAIGEAYTAHVSAASGINLAITNTQLFSIDISARFPGLAAGDYCGYQFNMGSAHSIGLLGILMRHIQN